MSDADALAAADESVREAQAAVEEVGEERLRALRDARQELLDLLGRYEGRATGTGDFRAYVEFQDRVATLVENLPEDLLHREDFERADELLQQRRLSEADFERVRNVLEPAGDLTARLDEREDARHAYRSTRHAVVERIREVDERVDRLDSLLAFEDVDLDAPVDELREPIRDYNDAVADAFEDFRASAGAREFVRFLDRTEAFPLVPFDQPPPDLREYLMGPAGETPVDTLLEYAGYSRSKLGHYVDDPDGLKRRVATNRTYLEGLDAAPLTVSWPPPPASELRWRVPELVSAVSRFAPPPVVERLRAVDDLARDEERYVHLRRAAVARDRLDETARERLQSGDLARERDDLLAERDRLAAALDEYPER